MDESHCIKNDKSVRTRAAEPLMKVILIIMWRCGGSLVAHQTRGIKSGIAYNDPDALQDQWQKKSYRGFMHIGSGK